MSFDSTNPTDITLLAGEHQKRTNGILMGDNVVLSSASPESPSGAPLPTKLRLHPEEESLVQPGTFVHDLSDPLEGELTMEKLMACGRYSEVYRGRWTRPSADPISVAIKRVRLIPDADDEGENRRRFERRVKREVVVWQAAKHANILEFYGFKIINGDHMFVSPWCENGNLNQYTSRHPELTDVQKLNLLHDAAQGLAHLHSLTQPIIHGDVKPENIMITNEIKGVLCDFGVSRVVTSLGIHTGLTSAGQCSGTAGFQAKELHEQAQPTTMCDVYAFGGVILATMSGKAPFHKKLGMGRAAFAATILAVHHDETPTPSDHPALPESDRLWDLMKACWSAEPHQRPNTRTLCDSLLTEIEDRSIALISKESIIQPGFFVHDPTSPLEGTFVKARLISSGSWSDFYRGLWTRPNAESVPVAIKQIRRVYLNGEDEQANKATFEKLIKREIFVWKTVKQENILEFHGFQVVDGDILLVSAWCKNGNLRQYIKTHPQLDDVKRLELLHDAVEGLSHLHSLKPPIIHGDIKPDNVMVTNDIHGVLCDFGISRVMISLGKYTGLATASQGAGTAGFQAKELYEEHSQPTPMSDVYAFGGVILATMSGKPPFHQKMVSAAIILAIVRDQAASPADHPELPESDPLWGLLKKCWDARPDRRPCGNEIITELVGEIQRRSDKHPPLS